MKLEYRGNAYQDFEEILIDGKVVAMGELGSKDVIDILVEYKPTEFSAPEGLWCYDCAEWFPACCPDTPCPLCGRLPPSDYR
jgi:hypothetical protein